MKSIISTLLFSICFIACFAQSASEIIIFDIQVRKNKVVLNNPQNFTKHPGYDNQPSFHTDESIVYYSSFNDEGRAEIKSYNYKTRETKFITQTNEREYSPTLTPDQKSISCIIQRDNGAQDLGKYPAGGGDPTTIISNLVVGYHEWIDNSHLALFILGTPQTLHYMQLPTQRDTVIASNIGRSIKKIPNTRSFSFIHKLSDTDWKIKKFDTENRKVAEIAQTLPGREDICWLGPDKILSSDGQKLFFMNTNDPQHWVEAEIKQGKELLKGVTRIAVNANLNKLAVVVSE